MFQVSDALWIPDWIGDGAQRDRLGQDLIVLAKGEKRHPVGRSFDGLWLLNSCSCTFDRRGDLALFGAIHSMEYEQMAHNTDGKGCGVARRLLARTRYDPGRVITTRHDSGDKCD
ncbi:hypothetical protein ACWDRB_54655 [Nonomuraea sp. NPDC003707]